jgi:hypothetical protein
MILISQNKTAAVELKNLYLFDNDDHFTVTHISDHPDTYYALTALAKYPTREEAAAQIEAIAKALEAGRQVYKFD